MASFLNLHASIGRRQIDAQTSGSGRQEEHVHVGVVVEGVNVFLTVLEAHGPVESWKRQFLQKKRKKLRQIECHISHSVEK